MKKHTYVIIGAGPAGLQTAYYLKKYNMDYMIVDSGSSAGSFFKLQPRHRKLISINKFNTGSNDPEFNLRHDWNSLLTDDNSILFKDYDKALFPNADNFVNYLNDFSENNELNIQYNSIVSSIHKSDSEFTIEIENRDAIFCKHLIIATGFNSSSLPTHIPGIEHTEDYSDISTDKNDFTNKRVLIIGKGNSAFETADHLAGSASLIHIASPENLKFAWSTHYVGHLRAVNNNFLDMYQLKSQHASLDAEVKKIERVKDKLNVTFSYLHAENEVEEILYDTVITCTGFKLDSSIFSQSCMPELAINGRYPALKDNFESENIANMFFAGTLTHSLDYGKSTSGFVHGFRYNCRALATILREQHVHSPWPSMALSKNEVVDSIINRINTASSIWQQPGFFSDVICIRDGIHYFKDVPINYALSMKFKNAEFFCITLEYGKSTEGDIFAQDRIHKDNHESASHSKFLHPIIRHYVSGKLVGEHHIVEDLEAVWRDDDHIRYLKEFIELEMAPILEAQAPLSDLA